jgi:mercuric reductase
VGGGYIGLELGQMFSRFGAEVTILNRNERLLAHGYEPELGESIGEIFGHEGIRVIHNVTARSVQIEERGIVVKVRSGNTESEMRAECMLVTTGRCPNSDRIALEKAGVAAGDHGQILVEYTCGPTFRTYSPPAT